MTSVSIKQLKDSLAMKVMIIFSPLLGLWSTYLSLELEFGRYMIGDPKQFQNKISGSNSGLISWFRKIHKRLDMMYIKKWVAHEYLLYGLLSPIPSAWFKKMKESDVVMNPKSPSVDNKRTSLASSEVGIAYVEANDAVSMDEKKLLRKIDVVRICLAFSFHGKVH